jgi:prefoldin subunit 5
MSEQTLQFILNNGVAVATLVAVGFGLYLLGKAVVRGLDKLFTHVLVPMKDAVLKHLEDVSEYLQKTTTAIDSLQGTLEKIDKKLPDGK